MKDLLISLLFLLAMIASCKAQVETTAFNLDFEANTQNQERPDHWIKWGEYTVLKDTATANSGKYSGVIYPSPNAQNPFGSIAFAIPANYEGDEITLEGYMKIEEVADGFAGLLMRLDGNGRPLAFDNMQNQSITGTHDWKKYTITLPFPEEAEQIYVAGILVGKGKAWFDDFEVFIDGENIKSLKPVAKKQLPAALDTAFDHGSEIKINKLSDTQIQNLYKLGKVWGFVKYHHPEIASGNVNWDYELFRILPNVLEKSTEGPANEEIRTWLSKLGKIDTSKADVFETKNINLNPDTAWIKDQQLLGTQLSEALLEIQNAENLSKHYLLTFHQNVGNPDFSNEQTYSKINFSDDGFKLLGLYRYWNMIEYFFPNRQLMDEDWDNVLKAFIPKMIEADDELSYKLTLIELIGKIQDTHANIWQQDQALNQFWGTNVAPIQIKFIEEKPVITRLFDELKDDTNLQIGDIITKVNGKDVVEMVEEKIKYCPASNRPTQLRDVTAKLLRTNDSTLTLSLDGKEDITVNCVDFTRINFWQSDTPSHKVLEDNIGYIYPGSLEKGEINEIMNEFKDTEGIVIDMRCYPSDFIVFSLGARLVPAPTPFVKFTNGSLENPGQFTFTPTLQVGIENEDYYKGNIVIIIDETTQSQAEYTTMALRVAPKATVIGSTTAGADGNVSEIFLPGNVRTMISGIGVYYPDGTETQRVGIVPDIALSPTIAGIKTGKDELLEKAIELCKSGVNN